SLLAQFAEQPRVLHRYDRLRREVFEQRDPLVCERSHFLAINNDRSKQGILFSERYGEPGTDPSRFDTLLVIRISPIRVGRQHIDDIENALAPHERLEQVTRPRPDRTKLHYALGYARLAVHRNGMKSLAIVGTEHPE